MLWKWIKQDTILILTTQRHHQDTRLQRSVGKQDKRHAAPPVETDEVEVKKEVYYVTYHVTWDINQNLYNIIYQRKLVAAPLKKLTAQ